MNKKKIAGEAAKEYVRDGMTLGLGTGSTAFYVIQAVGKLVSEGMDIRAVSTSKATEDQALELGITLLSIDEVEYIDLTIDGVDEVDQHFNAIKGGGGALYREKVVASISKEVIWVMDDSKLVESIGHFPLPVEIAQFGHRQVIRRLETLGFSPVLRQKEDTNFVTDNGNYIVDLHFGGPIDVEYVRSALSDVIGVLEHGLFLKMCDRLLVGYDDGVRAIERRQN